MEKLSPERWQLVDDLFAAALDRAPSEREAFVRAACGHDPELERWLRKLLADAVEAERALGESVSEFAAPLLPGLRAEMEGEEPATLADGRVGPYRILREIGRGGMGAVYLAERADEQFRKQVALKLVKRGMDTDEVLQRFRYERQILASLEHPNVARLYDGGATDDGRPYLVMEYIEGRPLTDYCDERRLPVRERLRLFATVCDAVQFAHRNLVIHRDLKPSNILVTTGGTVKLLDFGIAKLLTPGDPEDAPLTRPEMRLLTPEYAAPEQMEGAPVTTASDVYALGVVLYELLTGRRPHDRRDRRRRIGDGLSLLVDVERPSAAVARLAPTRGAAVDGPGTEIAELRSTTPDRLRRTLQGDLDTIVQKALAEEPDHRYQSAEQLLADVRRYLGGHPVLARGDSLGYRARKFVRRHRIATSLAASIVVLVSGFTVTTLIQAREVARARAVAEARQAQAEDLIGFMLGDLRGKLVPIGRLDVLNDVGNKALEYFASVPEEELSDQELFRRSEALRLLGQVQLDQGNTEAAARTFGESLALAEGLARRDSLNGSWQLGLGASLYWLGYLGYRQQDAGQALEYWRRYLGLTQRLVRQEPDSLTYRLELSYAHGNVGTALEAQGQLDDALREYRFTLDQKRRLTEMDPGNVEFRSALANSYNKLAVVQRKQGDLRSALENHREELTVRAALAAADTANAEDARLLSLTHVHLSDLLLAMGRDAEGLTHAREASRLQRGLVRRDPSNTVWRVGLAVSQRLVGGALLRNGRGESAVDTLQTSLAILRELLRDDPNRPDLRQQIAKAETLLASAYRRTGRPEPARAAAERALSAVAPLRAARPEDPGPRRDESEALLELGRSLDSLGRPGEAADAWRAALSAIGPAAGPAASTEELGTRCLVLLHLDRLEEARPILWSLLSRGFRRTDLLDLARAKAIPT